jgi:NAD-dependent SIR2 family protein deacetylase
MSLGTWCALDGHERYAHCASFNDWLDGSEDDALDVLDRLGLASIRSPSKALFAGDPVAYYEELKRFRAQRRDRALGEGYLPEHWVQRNRARFVELLGPLKNQNVTPFVGAGVSCAAGLPSWRSHLLRQGRTAGLVEAVLLELLERGMYEAAIDLVIEKAGPSVFVQEIKADFLDAGYEISLAKMIVELARGLLVTTNYDKVLEAAVASTGEKSVPVLQGTSEDNTPLIRSLTNGRRAILKIHGDVDVPGTCILTGSQYDKAYGPGLPELKRAVPKKLQKIYEQRTLLFLGCSLWNDRTLKVFERVREDTGPDSVPPHFAIVEAPEEADIPARNKFLADIGISAIFYPAGQHDKLPVIIGELLASMFNED